MSPQIVRRCLLAAALAVATWNLAVGRPATSDVSADSSTTASSTTASSASAAAK